ncbi:hypothetical protein SHIRM173S_09608 [Streptomyces hirsutus]
MRGQLVEVWQANSAGRYAHQREQHDAPLDPNFTGAGRTLTDGEGFYRFTTIQPGPYPWRNHVNAWRPAHIHFSVFGTAFTQRLVTQMYFPNDPLFPYDPILQSVTDDAARQRLVATYDHSLSVPEFSSATTGTSCSTARGPPGRKKGADRHDEDRHGQSGERAAHPLAHRRPLLRLCAAVPRR